MRRTAGGIIHVADVIDEDLKIRHTNLSKPKRRGLADLAASVLVCRSVNTSEIANILPRDVKSDEERYRYINRWLASSSVSPLRVMQEFVPEILEGLAVSGQTIILMLDQSKISKEFECLMVSLRIGERAPPVLWRVMQTKGEIGFEEQKSLLEKVAEMIPPNVKVLLIADRFYGTASLIKLCQKLKWGYRVRLKGNLALHHQGGEIKTSELINYGSIENAELNETGVKTHIGILQETNHAEPWIIAMDCKPTHGRILNYGMRWGIESLFLDMKTRGFGITKTQLKHADR